MFDALTGDEKCKLAAWIAASTVTGGIASIVVYFMSGTYDLMPGSWCEAVNSMPKFENCTTPKCPEEGVIEPACGLPGAPTCPGSEEAICAEIFALLRRASESSNHNPKAWYGILAGLALGLLIGLLHITYTRLKEGKSKGRDEAITLLSAAERARGISTTRDPEFSGAAQNAFNATAQGDSVTRPLPHMPVPRRIHPAFGRRGEGRTAALVAHRASQRTFNTTIQGSSATDILSRMTALPEVTPLFESSRRESAAGGAGAPLPYYQVIANEASKRGAYFGIRKVGGKKPAWE